MRTPVAVAGEVGAECVAMAAEVIMVCEAAAAVVTTAVVIAVVAIMGAVVAIMAVVATMEAVVAIMAAVSTPVPSITVTVTVTVIIVAATVMVIGAAVFGSRPVSSATAPAVIARGSTTTTTAVGCMNANKHTQRAAVSRMGYPMIGKPATPTQRNTQFLCVL